MSYEEYYEYGFGKLPKAKYILYVDGNVRYSFTTTFREEDECLGLLKEKFKDLVYDSVRYYKIVKKTKEYEKVLEKGTF